MCWVVVSFFRWARIQNFRPLGPLFLVEVEFPGGWWGGMNSNNRVKPNLRLRLRWVVVRLGFWQKGLQWIVNTNKGSKISWMVLKGYKSALKYLKEPESFRKVVKNLHSKSKILWSWNKRFSNVFLKHFQFLKSY